MTVPNPDHLLQQAERLIAPSGSGALRQVDIRRSISAAYYSVVHFCLTAAADEFVGASQRATARYALVYRSVDHQTLRRLGEEARKQTTAARYRPYVPVGGFDANIQAFCAAVIDLQEKRHSADYDPLPRFRRSDANLAIQTAGGAMRRFQAADETHRKAFLTLLLFSAR